MAIERIRSGFLKVAGYLVPLIQSMPAWTGLMTLPFASYLILVFLNSPINISRVFQGFFAPFLILEKVLIIMGLFILVYSVIYLILKRKVGLVTSGPYRLVRHPQYLGIILATIGFTSWSIWILNNTFGIGFLSPSQTLVVWFIELLAYVLLAYIEELFLSKKFREYESYKSQTPRLIPFLKTNNKYLDIPLSILMPVMLLVFLINIQVASY